MIGDASEGGDCKLAATAPHQFAGNSIDKFIISKKYLSSFIDGKERTMVEDVACSCVSR